MGFGRACAPVRCAHPSFWVHCHTNRGAAPTPPSQLRCFSFDPHKYIKSIQLGPPTSNAFFTPLDHMQTAEAMKYEVPWPRPSQLRWSFPQYFGVKIMCRCDHTPYFFGFSFFNIGFGSFLFVILFFLFSSYSSLFILLFLSLLYHSSSSYSSLLSLLYHSSSYILNWLLYYRHEIAFTNSFGVKINVYGAIIYSNFFV